MMNYYNKKHKKINLRDFSKIGYGGYSTVYRNGSIIFKKYDDSIRDENLKISEELFNILKNIHNEHLEELYDLYTKTTLLKSYLNSSFVIDGYTAKYYKKTDIDLLFTPMDYIFDNFNELEKLFDSLAEYLITVRDIRLDNAIIRDEYITMIDPDLYQTNQGSIETNKYINKKALLSFFNQILFKYLFDDYDIETHPDIFKYLENVHLRKITIRIKNITPDTSVTDSMHKILKPYNHLFDYMVHECKK